MDKWVSNCKFHAKFTVADPFCPGISDTNMGHNRFDFKEYSSLQLLKLPNCSIGPVNSLV